MDIIAKKCCIRYDPPTLILFYEIPLSGKLHRRSIPVNGKQQFKDGNAQKLLDYLLTTHHTKYIKQFKKEQLFRLLNMLIENQDGLNITLDENRDISAPENPGNISFDLKTANLNKLTDQDLDAVKKEMNYSFEEHRVKPNDENWKYDIEVDFDDKNPGQGGAIESAGWDDESDMEF